ncbi:hypothetical protein [Propionivibrio sp.]|uniref:hypothetical protein n=1 Tax=Propionivibrio sp. TaxID=2212460 RepID=UPI003BF44616
MQKAGKKVAAALAAVQLYLQQEEEAASYQAEPLSSGSNIPTDPGQWAQSGRMEMMSGRRMVQLRAFSNAR